jgi:DNA-binding CsgD family transcriptional regulator
MKNELPGIDSVLSKLGKGLFHQFSDQEELVFLRMVVDSVQASLYVNFMADLNDTSSARLVWMNKYGLDLMGYTLEEAFQMGAKLYGEVIPHEDSGVLQESIDFMKPGKSDCFRGIYRQMGKAGTIHWCYGTCKVIARNENHGACFINTQVNIEDEMQTRQQLVELQKENLRLKHQLLINGLTIREREIVVLLAHGGTDRKISGQLNISLETARTHRRNILKKLGMNKTTEVAVFVSEAGLI